jgi:LuxR family maltose regulon positive regulatory protein
VLDDVHLLKHPDVLALAQTLLSRLPQPMHLALISRTPPPLHLIRLRLADALIELDATTLAFDAAEFQAFVRAGPLARRSPTQLAALQMRADGWIAALQMFALADEQTTAAPQIAIEAYVTEFLQDEILRHQPDDILDALVRTSLLPHLDAVGLAAILEVSTDDAEHLVRRIAAADLLAQTFAPSPPVDAHGVAVRLHPLLRQHLVHRLERTVTAEHIAALKRRASGALAGHGDIDAALALFDFNDAPAARLLAAHSRAALLRYDLTSLRRWLRNVSASAMHAHPQLAVDAAWLAHFLSERSARAHVDAASAALADAADGPPPDVRDEWTAELCVLDGLVALDDGDFERAHRALDRVARMPHAADGMAAAYRLYLAAHLPGQIPNIADQIAALRTAAAIFRSIGMAHSAIHCLTTQGMLHWRVLDLPRSLIAFDQAVAVMRSENRERTRDALDVHVVRAESAYFMNRIDDARADVRQAQAIAAAFGTEQPFDYALTLRAQLCDLADGVAPIVDDAPSDAPSDARDEARWAHERASHGPIVYGRSAWLRILRDHRLGRTDRILATVHSLGPAALCLDPNQIDWIRLAAFTGRVLGDELVAGMPESLRLFRADLESNERGVVLIYTQALEVALLLKQGDVLAARSALRALLPIIERNRAMRVLLDFPQLAHLLIVENSLYAQLVVANMPVGQRPSDAPFSLSARECEIAALLCTGRTHTEIEEALSIARNTLRVHMRNIYRKMGVHSRAEAVRAARAVGIAEIAEKPLTHRP